jgi:hypothetical protein
MGKISDLWVKLGLKKEGFDKGMDDVKKTSEGTFSKIKAGAVAAWAAVGAAVVKFATDLKNQTNSLSDAWDVMTAKMQARWQTFLVAVTNGFDGFANKMKASVKAAEEYAKAIDENFEIQNAIKLQRAEMAAELAALEVMMRDVNLTYDERLKAIEDYRDKSGKIYKQIADQAKYLEEKTFGKFIAGGNLPDTQQVRDDLRRLLKDGFADRELMDALGTMLSREEELKAAEDLIAYQRSIGQYNPEFEAAYMAKVPAAVDLSKWQKDYGTDLVELFRLYNNYRGDADVMALVEAMLAAYGAEAQEDIDTRRIQTLENSLKKQQPSELSFEEALAEARQAIEDSLNEEIEPVEIEIEIEPVEIDFSANEAALDEIVERHRARMEEIATINQMLEDSIVQSLSGGLQAFTYQLMGLDNAGASSVLSALLVPFADMAVRLGEIVVAEGLAVNAVNDSLSNPLSGGAAPIAAGLALIAIGSAVRSGMQAMARGGAGGAGAAYGAGSASSEMTDINTEMTIYVKGRLDGGDIVLSGQKTTNKWAR